MCIQHETHGHVVLEHVMQCYIILSSNLL